MYYTHKILLSFLVVAILGGEQLVAAGWIGQRRNIVNGLLTGRDGSSETVTVDLPDFGILTKYVCPNIANVFRRQTTPGTITIPKGQLRALLSKLRAVEISLLDTIDALLAADGLDSTSSSALAAKASTTRVHVTVTALQTMTMTRTRTRSVTSPGIAGKTSLAVLSTAKSTSKVVQASKSQETQNHDTVKATATARLVSEKSTSKARLTATTSAIPTKYGNTNTTGYKFNARSSSNVAVYFGQTPKTGSTTLLAQCADPDIDIVILAFVFSQLSGGQYPAVNFGAACGGQTPAQTAQAPGLLNCPALAGYIKACQETYGKKVLLSIGGATSQLAFTNTAQANAFGDVLWNLFGPPGNVDIALRPFGTVVIDGFDIGMPPSPSHTPSESLTQPQTTKTTTRPTTTTSPSPSARTSPPPQPQTKPITSPPRRNVRSPTRRTRWPCCFSATSSGCSSTTIRGARSARRASRPASGSGVAHCWRVVWGWGAACWLARRDSGTPDLGRGWVWVA